MIRILLLTAVTVLAILFAGAASDLRSAGIDIAPLTRILIETPPPGPEPAPPRHSFQQILSDVLG